MNRKTAVFLISLLMFSFIGLIQVNRVFADTNEEPQDKQVSILSGEWEFYWQELLVPDDFADLTRTATSLTVPDSWKNQSIDGQKLPQFGYGTYRKQFHISQDEIGTQQALSLYYIGSAYRVWINGKEYPGLGQVGTNKEGEIPRLQRNIILFSPTDDHVEIVIQASNFSFRESGIISDIQYGDANTVNRSVMLTTFLSLLEIGATFLFGIYHFAVYWLRRTDFALFYIGLIAIGYSIRTFLITEYVVDMFIPYVPWVAVIRLEYLVEMTIVILLGLFLRYMFPHDVNRVLFRIFVTCTSLATVYVAVTPTEIFTSLYHALIIVTLLIIVIIDITIRVKLRKREDANLYLAGVLILLGAAINDTLNYAMVFQTFYMVKYAFILFIAIQAVIISNRYARIHENNANLTKDLLVLNNTLEEKIEARTEELSVKNKELEQLQITRTKMLANIAHDIGTPLAGVRTYLQIIKDDKIKVPRHRLFPELIDKVTYIQHLNHDLLELSKLESNQLALHTEEVQVRTLLQDVITSLRIDIPADNAMIQFGTIQTNIDGIEAIIHVDRRRITQVMQNFVSNAIKYNDSVEKIVTIHGRVQPKIEQNEARYEVVIKFEDNGNGIIPAEIQHIFEQFYRKVEGNVEGSGLGLAIVKAIIEQHGGQVGASNKKEAGAIFYFTLPASLEGQSPRSDF